MKLHRFIGDFILKPGNTKLSDKELLSQIRNVLKLRVGERVVLCDGNMNEGIGELKGYSGNIIDIKILETMKNQNEPDRHVILYCSVLKKDNFELVV